MSNSEIHKIVFVIGPCFETEVTQEEWNERAKLVILQWMCHFITYASASLEKKRQCALSHVKWAYRFLDAPFSNFSATKEWKDFSVSEMLSFEEDFDCFLKTKPNAQYSDGHHGRFTGGAHQLSEELMAIVHDYNWEKAHLATPRKRTKPKFMKSYVKSSKTHQQSCFKMGEDENLPQNMVVLLSPTPCSQAELNAYFEWHVQSVDYVSRTLMPQHLHLYFREKYNISLFWIDMAITKTSHDAFGVDILRKFLKSVGGDAIPLSVFSTGRVTINGVLGLHKYGEHKFSVALRHKHADEISNLIDVVIKAEGQMEDGEDSLVHVCEIKPIEPNCNFFKSEKICASCLRWNEASEKQNVCLLSQICRLCTNRSQNLSSMPKVFCQLTCPIPTLYFSMHNCATKVGNIDKSTILKPETVFAPLGTLSLAQIYTILDSGSASILNTVWCMVETPKTSIGLSFDSLKQRVMVAEVCNCCAHCGREPSAYGFSKYVLLQFVSETLAVSTFLSSVTSDVLNCVVPWTTCLWRSHFTSKLSSKHSVLECCDIGSKQDFQPNEFYPAIFQKWWELIPDDNLRMIITKQRPSSSDDVFLDEIPLDLDIVKTLQDIYSETKIQHIQQKTSSLGTESTLLQMKPLSLHEQYQNALQLVAESTPPDNFPSHYDSFTQAARSIVSTVVENARVSCPEGTALKMPKKSECLIVSLKEIKESNVGMHKLSHLVMQILLRMEFARLMSPYDDCIEMVDELPSILRLIALSISHGAMVKLLGRTLVDNYSDTCGMILYEVLNELMQPIPSCLSHVLFSKDDMEMSSDILSVPSAYSKTHSVTNSTRRSRSCGGMDSSSRNQRLGVSSSLMLARQIEMPGRKKEKRENKKNAGNNDSEIKAGLQSSNNSAQSYSELFKIRNIKRDLFCKVEEESRLRDHSYSSPDRNKLQKLKVSDTPNVKQRLTALSRQRLRLRRVKKRGSSEEMRMLSVVDESPVKLDGSAPCEINTNRVARLTRRHSFYCAGVGSRNASRAKNIQQRQQVVLLTPKPEDEVVKRKEFHEILDPSPVKVSGNAKTENVDNLAQRPRQSCARRAMKSLFQSPVRRKPSRFMQEDRAFTSNMTESPNFDDEFV